MPTTPARIQAIAATHLEDFADMAGIEHGKIGRDTDLYRFKQELRWNDLYYQLKTS